jgi:hypothetical protein
MDFEFKYVNYQDVRRNLFKYSIAPLLLATIVILFVLLPPDWRHAFFDLVGKLKADGWSEVIGFASKSSRRMTRSTIGM